MWSPKLLVQMALPCILLGHEDCAEVDKPSEDAGPNAAITAVRTVVLEHVVDPVEVEGHGMQREMKETPWRPAGSG